MKASRSKIFSSLEIFQIVVGVIVSVSTLIIGWKTYELNDKTNENNIQLKNIDRQLSEAKFGFERIRDIYDRAEKYLASTNQDERRGRALVVLISSLPDSESSLRSDLLSIIVREATNNSVAATAADVKQGKTITEPAVLKPPLDSKAFFGTVNLKFDPDKYTVETLDSFGFKDSTGLVWEVPKGKIFDGSSIPRAFWNIAGSPLTGNYVPGAILHQYYSHLRTHSPEQVNKMFYESLLKSGLTDAQAKTFYTAVEEFGPKWIKVE